MGERRLIGHQDFFLRCFEEEWDESTARSMRVLKLHLRYLYHPLRRKTTTTPLDEQSRDALDCYGPSCYDDGDESTATIVT